MSNFKARQFIGQGNDRTYEPLKTEDIPTKKEPYIASTSLAEAVNDAAQRPVVLDLPMGNDHHALAERRHVWATGMRISLKH